MSFQPMVTFTHFCIVNPISSIILLEIILQVISHNNKIWYHNKPNKFKEVHILNSKLLVIYHHNHKLLAIPHHSNHKLLVIPHHNHKLLVILHSNHKLLVTHHNILRLVRYFIFLTHSLARRIFQPLFLQKRLELERAYFSLLHLVFGRRPFLGEIKINLPLALIP